MTAGDGAVLVTGAGGRIGRAVVAAVARESRPVVALDLDLPAAERAVSLAGAASAVALRCDVRHADQVAEAFSAAEDAVGPITGVVNAHGVFPNTPLVEIDLARWEDVLAANATSVLITIQQAFRRWIQRGTAGAIVTVTSIAAGSARAGGAAYCSSKAAVEMLTKVAAIEGGPHGIRVNAVAPGLVLDELIGPDTPGVPDYFAKTVAATPLRRTGLPTEVADACVFLVGPRSGWTTGAVLPVTGGADVGRTQMPFTSDLQ